MKKIILICVLLTNVAFAQNQSKSFQLQWCKPQKAGAKNMMYSSNVLGIDDNNIYMLFDKGHANIQGVSPQEIFQYNTTTQVLKKAKFSLKSDGNTRDYENAIMIKDKIYIFSSFQNKKHKKHYLFAQTVNKNTLELNSDIIKVAELDYSGESKKRPAIFNFSLSSDMSKLLINYVLLDKNNIILRSGFNVYDNNCEPIWQTYDISSGVDGIFSYGEFAVDNTGNVYFDGRLYKDEKTYAKEEESAKYYVVTYQKGDRTPKAVEVKLPSNKYPVSTKIALNNKGELYCAGFFSQMGMSNAVGMFSAKVDMKKKAVDANVKNFDMNYLTKGMDEGDIKSLKKKMEKGDNYEDYSYLIKDIHFREDNTLVMVAEKNRINVTIITGKGGTTYQYHHFNGDIVVADFKNDASFNWVQKIPRDKKLSNNFIPMGSFGVLYGKNNTTEIFYNVFTGSHLFRGFGNAEVANISIDKNGKESWTMLDDMKTSKIMARPANIVQNKQGEVFILGQKAWKANFAKIVFK